MNLQPSLAVLLRDMDDLLVPHFEAVDTITENENARPPNLDVTVKTGRFPCASDDEDGLGCAPPTQLTRDRVSILALRMECNVKWEPIEKGWWSLVFTKEAA